MCGSLQPLNAQQVGRQRASSGGLDGAKARRVVVEEPERAQRPLGQLSDIGDGLGGALMIPAAYLTVDPSKYDPSGNDITRQQLTYKASRFGGDVSESGAGNSPVRLALGV